MQSRGARWITGAFKMTPVGALEIAARLMPIHLAVNKFMHRVVSHIKTLPNMHAIKWNMPPGGCGEYATDLSEFTLARYSHRAIKTRDADTLYLHAHNIIQFNLDEIFYVLNDENRPGDHLLNSHLSRIWYEVEDISLKGKNAKDQKIFEHWVMHTFKPMLESHLSKANITILFTDSSQMNIWNALQHVTSQNTKTSVAFKLTCTNHLGKNSKLTQAMQNATLPWPLMPKWLLYAWTSKLLP